VRPPAIFFDVDETLITVKSMFSFLEFYLDRRDAPPGTYRRRLADLNALAQSGASRSEVNREYYAAYAGERAADLVILGREWFAAQVALGGLFHPVPLAELTEGRQAGSRIYLVSGSFFACLDPIAEAVGATAALGTQLHVERGLLTGEVSTPMIGEEKARTARHLMASLELDPRDCLSYGDHQSDVPFLSTTGNSVVVGDNSDMLAIALERGWRVIRQPSGQLA
jgi:HAD superfamily hydrolase (TIGR01490 family)